VSSQTRPKALRSELNAGANSWGNEHHAFGSAVNAHWDTYLDDDPATINLWEEKGYRMKDIGFIVPNRRQCSNRSPVPITERHFDRVTGCSSQRRYVIGKPVMKLARKRGARLVCLSENLARVTVSARRNYMSSSCATDCIYGRPRLLSLCSTHRIQSHNALPHPPSREHHLLKPTVKNHRPQNA
jgi:hypothetical protein